MNNAYEVKWLSQLANLKEDFTRAKLQSLFDENPFAFRKLQRLMNEILNEK